MHLYLRRTYVARRFLKMCRLLEGRHALCSICCWLCPISSWTLNVSFCHLQRVQWLPSPWINYKSLPPVELQSWPADSLKICANFFFPWPTPQGGNNWGCWSRSSSTTSDQYDVVVVVVVILEVTTFLLSFEICIITLFYFQQQEKSPTKKKVSCLRKFFTLLFGRHRCPCSSQENECTGMVN